MTVCELIDLLNDQPPEATVLLETEYGGNDPLYTEVRALESVTVKRVRSQGWPGSALRRRGGGKPAVVISSCPPPESLP